MKPPSPTTPRRLTRSRGDRMLAGVAGGIAETYGLDPALVRLTVFVLILATLGTGLVAYGIAWLVVPEADADEPVLTTAAREARHRPHDGRLWIGVLLVLVGVATLADRFRIGGLGRVVWPLMLIGVGGAVLLLRDRDVRDGFPDGEGSGPTVSPPTAGPGGPTEAGPTDTTDATGTTGATGRTEPSEPSDTVGPSGLDDSSSPPGVGAPFGPPAPPAPPSAYPPSLPWPEPPRPRMPRVRRRRERSMLGRFTWGALLIVAGAAWLISITGAVGVDARFVLALELVIVGVALLIGTWFGRARGLIAIGLVLTFFAGTFAALDVPLRGDVGEHIVHPATIGALDHRYRLAIGHLELDLDRTTLDDRPHRVVLTDAIGFIEVFVPANARVEVISRSDVGSVDILGRPTIGGTHAHNTVVDDPPGSSGPRIVIDAHVGFGAVKVTRTSNDSAHVPQEVSS